MKINFEISQETFDRIHKELNGKLTDEVINKGIDVVVKPRDKKSKMTDTYYYRHTKILEAKVNGENIEKPSWRGVVIHMLKLAVRNRHNIGRVKEIFPGVSIEKGNKSGHWKYIPEIDHCIYNSNGPSMPRVIKHAADTLGFKIYIKFQWYDKPKASRPGEVDCIEV